MKYYPLICLVIILSCGQSDPPPVPLVKLETLSINRIMQYSAECKSIIQDDGGSAIIRFGVCWSTHSDPTLSDFKTSDNFNFYTGKEFKSVLTGLSMGTGYFIRAYATNGYGTTYAEPRYFETPACSENDTGLILTDFKKYSELIVGTWELYYRYASSTRHDGSNLTTIDENYYCGNRPSVAFQTFADVNSSSYREVTMLEDGKHLKIRQWINMQDVHHDIEELRYVKKN